MKQLKKTKKGEIVARMNLNYNNVFSNMKMLLGKDCEFFADITIMSQTVTWSTYDDAEYTPFTSCPQEEQQSLALAMGQRMNQVRTKLQGSKELGKYADDILEIPDSSYLFFRKTSNGYQIVLAGWGWKQANVNPSLSYGLMKHIKTLSHDDDVLLKKADAEGSSNAEAHVDRGGQTGREDETDSPISAGKTEVRTGQDTGLHEQNENLQPEDEFGNQGGDEDTKQDNKVTVILRVVNQNGETVADEPIAFRMDETQLQLVTNSAGTVSAGQCSVGSHFFVTLPKRGDFAERGFEVVRQDEPYDIYVKQVVNYSPLVYVEDSDGNAVKGYKLIVQSGSESKEYTSNPEGEIQLPLMNEGEKFSITDTNNYANTMTYTVSVDSAKEPYHFVVSAGVLKPAKVGLTIYDKNDSPLKDAIVSFNTGGKPFHQKTDSKGRVEFPSALFKPGNMPFSINANGHSIAKSKLRYKPEVSEYTFRLHNKGYIGWRPWMLLPLLAALGVAAYMIYDKYFSIPSWDELNKGIVLVKSEGYFTLETGLEGTAFSTLYFNYNENDKQIINPTFDASSAKSAVGTGTGFFISDDGMIVTNRHVANPIPPTEEAIALCRDFFITMRDMCKNRAQDYQKIINKYSTAKYKDVIDQDELIRTLQDSIELYNYASQAYSSLLDKSSYKVESHFLTFVAFDNSMINTWDDQAFVQCNLLASGEPGTVDANDLAIIQLNKKKNDMPKDYYVFKVPKEDPFLNGKFEQRGNRDIFVLGYSHGLQLADISGGIHPHLFQGHVSNTNNKYHIEYDNASKGGSSGSPVLDRRRRLVAVNNSGLGDANINFGVRTRYLQELIHKVKENYNQE